MAKIGVYVPDEKMPEVEKWRDKINFSRVFMDAFQREVRTQQMLQVSQNELENVVNRLRREFDEHFQAGKEAGLGCGTAWAKDEAYLRQFRELCDPPEGADPLEENDFFRIVGECYEAFVDDQCKESGLDRPAYVAGYIEGFIEGARAIWVQVRDKL
ncbi:MAG: hypothetical protein NUV77_10325 [Thermoguttaceae bacterium]|jgi:hypothetical protein|nr:hypothetical protein [Thermoguttaceae bacterium]